MVVAKAEAGDTTLATAAALATPLTNDRREMFSFCMFLPLLGEWSGLECSLLGACAARGGGTGPCHCAPEGALLGAALVLGRELVAQAHEEPPRGDDPLLLAHLLPLELHAHEAAVAGV